MLDFVMNDKCAAGTGRFLEVMAKALEIEPEEMGERSLQVRHPVEHLPGAPDCESIGSSADCFGEGLTKRVCQKERKRI